MLKNPIRLFLYKDISDEWPVREISFISTSTNHIDFVDGSLKVEIIENGPVRKSLKLTMEIDASKYEPFISFKCVDSGNKLDFLNKINFYQLIGKQRE